MPGITVVFAATGTQGGSVIKELKDAGHQIRAVTRNARSKKAIRLSSEGIEVTEVDFDNQKSLDSVFDGADKVFYLLPMSKNSEEIGTRITEAIKRAQIKHAIFSSVGGTDRDNGVCHFGEKWRIEELLRNSGVFFTILRPAAYMEHFIQAKGAEFILGMMRVFMTHEKRIQMISTKDIARFVRLSYENPAKFGKRSIEIAGDELTLEQIRETLSEFTNKDVRIPNWPKILVPILPKTLKEMLAFYGKDGWQANIEELRKLNPDMLKFRTFLREMKCKKHVSSVNERD